MSVHDKKVNDKSSLTRNFLDHLNNVQSTGGGWLASCPAHDDRRPSLSITEGGDGRVLFHCHSGCRPESILEAMGFSWSDCYVAPCSRGVGAR